MNHSRAINLDPTIITCAQLRGLTFLFKGAAIRHLIELRRFNPNQPRVPRGHRYGGRWVAEGGNLGAQVQRVSHDLPELPEERPSSGRERHRVARLIAQYIEGATVALRLALLMGRFVWLADHAAKDIIAYLDDPKSLEELQAAVDEPKAGYDVHHVVEKTPARRDGISDERIEAPENRVRIPRLKHWEITGWYARPNDEFGGQSPRSHLQGADWSERYRIGIRALEDAGVLAP